MNWTQQIVDCMEHNRHLLKGVPLVLVATADYKPDAIFWRDYQKASAN